MHLLTQMLTCYAAYAASPGLPVGESDYFELAFFSDFHEPVSHAAALSAPDAQQWMAAMDEERRRFLQINLEDRRCGPHLEPSLLQVGV